MASIQQTEHLDQVSMPLAEQVVRLQALLAASRSVHSTIDLRDVLEQSVRIVVRELELDGALYTSPRVIFGEMPCSVAEDCGKPYHRFPLLSRSGELLTTLVVATPQDRALSLYEHDFFDGLVLQTAVAVENALNHQRHLDYARLSQDLDAARAIQVSLLPQTMPSIPGYAVAARSQACYQVGGDYLDVVAEPDGSYLLVVADVAGKGLASALVCTAFRLAFRALCAHSLPLGQLAERLSQQHWEEGQEARRRYVTAIFARVSTSRNAVEFVNAGHNPAFLMSPAAASPRLIAASGTPLGMLPNSRYTVELAMMEPGAHLLLYTDGLTETFREEEEFGQERLLEALHSAAQPLLPTKSQPAEAVLDALWATIQRFTEGAPQQDDMTAIALCRLRREPEEKA